MARSQKGRETSIPDVLILHGMSEDLVNFLVELLSSVGIYASYAEKLPSRRHGQEKKVDYYIKKCNTALVLATPDPKGRDRRKARPNVHDEIARCRHLKPQGTLVLLEKPVELGSNVWGQLVTIPFRKGKILLALPQLFRELKSRGLPKTVGPQREKSERAISSGKILNDFLDEMDRLWDNEFDKVWDMVYLKNHKTESNVTTTIEKFFLCYWNVFDAFVRKKKYDDDLKVICEAELMNAREHAARAWEYVAESSIAQVEGRARGRSTRAGLHEHILDAAKTELREGKRPASPEKKVERFKRAVQEAERFLKKVTAQKTS